MEWLVILLLLFLSAVFSGSEIAFISTSKLQAYLAKKGQKTSHLETFLQHPQRFLAMLLVANNIVLVALAHFLSLVILPQLQTHYNLSGWILFSVGTLLISVIILIFGEFIPKALFKKAPQKLLQFFSPLLYLTWKVLGFATTGLVRISQLLSYWLFKMRISDIPIKITADDVREFLAQTEIDDTEPEEKEMLVNALKVQNTRVRDIMIPRNEIVAVEKNAPLQQILNVFEEKRHSRIPVYVDNLDNVIGYIHHRDLLELKPKSKELPLKDILKVPKTMSVQSLLESFLTQGANIAIVVDEYGTPIGLVTLEDVLEEIFGEIEDEFDDEHIAHSEEKISDREFLLPGRAEIDYLNKKYPVLQIPEDENHYHTLAGYIVHQLNKIPEEGEQYCIEGHLFRIEDMQDARINRVYILLDHPSCREEDSNDQ